jgi:hypothetical protein
MLIQDIVPKPFYNAQDLHGKMKEDMVVHCYYTGGREYQCAGKTTRVREAELADEESVVVKSHENVGWVTVALMAHEDDMKEEKRDHTWWMMNEHEHERKMIRKCTKQTTKTNLQFCTALVLYSSLTSHM